MALNRSKLFPIIAGIIAVAAYTSGGAIWQEIQKSFGGKSSAQNSGRPAGQNTLLSNEDLALSKKLEPFISCINRVDRALMQHGETYKSRFAALSAKPDAEIFGLNFGFKIEVYETNNEFSRQCATGLEMAAKMPPSDTTLDRVAVSYAETLQAMIPHMNALDDYYSQKNFLDDKMARGKQIDAQFRPLLDKLGALSAEMRAAVEDNTNKLRANELVALEKQSGKDFSWHTLNILIEARKSLKAVQMAASKGKLSAADILPVEEKYQAAYEAANTYASAHPDTKTKLGNKPLWFSIASNARDVLAALKAVRRDVEAGKDPESGLRTLQKDFNSLIKNYNMQSRNGG
jgi:hypothetical protein